MSSTARHKSWSFPFPRAAAFAGRGHPAEGRLPDERRLMRPVVLLFLLAALVFCYAAKVFFDLHQQMLLGWGMYGLLLVTIALRPKNRVLQRLLVMFLGFFVLIRYFIFRTSETLVFTGPLDFVAMLALYLAECYAISLVALNLFVNSWPLERHPPPLPADDNALPSVDILIPTYNEPLEIVKITAVACTQLDYPRDRVNIYILDDGGTRQKLNDPDTLKARAAEERQSALRQITGELGIHYLARDDNRQAKAGNLNHGLAQSSGDLVAVLDCDHVPTRDFLKNTVGFFLQDEKLAVVQTPHFFINPNPVEKNLGTHDDVPGEHELFYFAVQPGMDLWNSAYFCGSAALLRRNAIAEQGGFSGTTITEDAETGLGLHARGYNSVYLSRPMVCGLSPESFEDFILQRTRWAQGMIQIFTLKNPLTLKGLKFYQRICYTSACVYWFFGLARLIFYFSPLAYVFFGLKVYNASYLQIIAYCFPSIFASLALNEFLFGKFRHPVCSDLYDILQSIFLAPAALSVLSGRRSLAFRVTPKHRSHQQAFLSRLAVPFYFMLFFCIVAYPAALMHYWAFPATLEVLLICLAWNTVNLVMLLMCLGVVWERRQVRAHHRILVSEAVQLFFPHLGRTAHATLHDLSVSGAGLTLDDGPELRRGDAVVLTAQDSYGYGHFLSCRIVRLNQLAGKTFLGCRFDTHDACSFASVVRYVYGDSARWLHFLQRRSARHYGMLQGYAYFLSKGISGFCRNLFGITRLAFDHVFRRRRLLKLTPEDPKRQEDHAREDIHTPLVLDYLAGRHAPPCFGDDQRKDTP